MRKSGRGAAPFGGLPHRPTDAPNRLLFVFGISSTVRNQG
ncbi:conserved hypothetical protein [Burkholderia pseudomallei MSHR346]|nr:conserved hypothetical protein [Burkholderia pseudomallei MSHR346]